MIEKKQRSRRRFERQTCNRTWEHRTQSNYEISNQDVFSLRMFHPSKPKQQQLLHHAGKRQAMSSTVTPCGIKFKTKYYEISK